MTTLLERAITGTLLPHHCKAADKLIEEVRWQAEIRGFNGIEESIEAYDAELELDK